MMDIRSLKIIACENGGWTMTIHAEKILEHAFTNTADMLKGLQAIVAPDKGSPDKPEPGSHDVLLDFKDLVKKQREHYEKMKRRQIQEDDAIGVNTHLYGDDEPDDGWRVWEGSLEGQRPAGVGASDLIEVTYREIGYGAGGPRVASFYRWTHYEKGKNPDLDIVAYRVVKP